MMKTFISQDRKMNSLTVLKKSPAKDAAWNKATALYLLLPAGRQASRKKKLLGYSKGKPERPEQQSHDLFSVVMQRRIEGKGPFTDGSV